jgi:uncharacterized integral membrane protein
MWAALAAWTKQPFAFVVLGIALYVGLSRGVREAARYAVYAAIAAALVSVAFTITLGFDRLYLNLVQVPALQGWRMPSCFTEGGAECTVAATGMQKVSAMVWAAGWVLIEESQLLVFAVLMLLALSLLQASDQDSVSSWFTKHRWTLPVIVGLVMTPAALSGKLKLGGESNTLSYALYFFAVAVPLGLLELADDRNGDRLRGRPAMGMLMALTLAVVPAALYRSVSLPKVLRGLPGNVHEVALAYMKAHPGEAYFPWNPLASLMAEGKVYHFEYGVMDREWAGMPLSTDFFRRHVPQNANIVAFHPNPNDTHTMRVLELLPEFSERTTINELPGWIVYRKPSAPGSTLPKGRALEASMP